jgi:hypothetical protein
MDYIYKVVIVSHFFCVKVNEMGTGTFTKLIPIGFICSVDFMV